MSAGPYRSASGPRTSRPRHSVAQYADTVAPATTWLRPRPLLRNRNVHSVVVDSNPVCTATPRHSPPMRSACHICDGGGRRRGGGMMAHRLAVARKANDTTACTAAVLVYAHRQDRPLSMIAVTTSGPAIAPRP
ncbi:hypothetical protein GCM10023322_11380 [Rugosimonospora acidiphila]|uniref:Uncharacterized protein n=1 Tax=Rugosimonospora acidiphila TaxID=556531 RepID=A0ABP9RL82_9ACTN